MKIAQRAGQPDEIVENVSPHRAQWKSGAHHRPKLAEGAKRLDEKADDDELRIAAEVSRDHAIAATVEADAHSQSAHDERIVDVRQTKQIEEQVGEEHNHRAQADVIDRGATKCESKNPLRSVFFKLSRLTVTFRRPGRSYY